MSYLTLKSHISFGTSLRSNFIILKKINLNLELKNKYHLYHNGHKNNILVLISSLHISFAILKKIFINFLFSKNFILDFELKNKYYSFYNC
jgi:hypothetical protein